MIKFIIKIFEILIFSIILAGCGFKLQGNHELPFYMKNLVIATENNNDSFQVLLKNILQNNGINLISNKFQENNITKKNTSILEVNTPTVTEQIHSYNSKGQVSQYRVIALCNYKLFDNNGSILRQNIISRSRTYSLNPNQLLSNASEQQIITEELNIEIINELLRQLSYNINNINNINNTNNNHDTNCPC